MPPRQTAKISSGLRQIGVEIVEQHVADAAAEHDAERHPDDQVVDVERASAAAAAGPESASRREALGIEPAAEEPDHIGERVPADREGADSDRDRIDDGKATEAIGRP